jgi:hypothetical protein
MNTPGALTTLRAHTRELDATRATQALRSALDADSASAVLLFCSGGYDLRRLGPAIASAFRGPVLACTAAGQIGPGGFERGGMTGLSLRCSDLSMEPHLLSPLSLCQSQAVSIARQHAARAQRRPGLRSFGVLLVDGVSMWEEFVAAALYESLGNVPLVGGSAGAGVAGGDVAVYHAGRFYEGAGVIGLFETSTLDFTTFTVQHFVPGPKKLVITLADPDRRVVYEINGEPAATAYARALEVDEATLNERHFACYPLLLDLGELLLPRAIRARNPDGSLLLACAIEEGLVVSIPERTDPIATLEAVLDDVAARLPPPDALLVFDCVARRTELETLGIDNQVGSLLARRGAVGFNGYGEQLGPMHTNHTLTGIALGASGQKGRH